jgi:hypothetical protein
MGLPRKVWTIDEYERMIEAGILTKDIHVELIRGDIVEKAYISPRHANCVNRLSSIFHSLLGRTAIIWNQNAVVMLGSEPEPDIVLLKYRDDYYGDRRPVVADVFLVGEVADITLATDRNIKMPLYAEAGMSEAWIVNLEEDVIEVYSEPADGAYQKKRVARKGSSVPLPGGLTGVLSVDEELAS